MGSAKAEKDVQHIFIQLFGQMLREFASSFVVHDTLSSNYLKNPPAKIDAIFSADGQVWQSLERGFELG